ncbi:MAG: MarR family winged helix-turn-helix transcriptional regulator [Alteraurantiacibacter sp.]
MASWGVWTLDWGILDGSIGPRVRLLRNSLAAGSLAVSEPFGLPTGSLTVLALIAANPGCAQVQLAARAGITGPSLVGIVAELEQRGLLTRQRDSADRRRNLVVLTAEGQALMEALFSQVTQIEASVRAALAPDEMVQLTALLDRAIAALGADHAT